MQYNKNNSLECKVSWPSYFKGAQCIISKNILLHQLGSLFFSLSVFYSLRTNGLLSRHNCTYNPWGNETLQLGPQVMISTISYLKSSFLKKPYPSIHSPSQVLMVNSYVCLKSHQHQPIRNTCSVKFLVPHVCHLFATLSDPKKL